MTLAIAPLVPPARLGALLVSRRTAKGLDIVEMSQRSEGLFSPAYLENAERGRVELDDRIIEQLVGLYEVHAGPVVPERHELILDLDQHELSVGESRLRFDSTHAKDVLERYVSLIYMLRGQEPGSDLVLRDRDLDVLAQSLGHSEEQLRIEIQDLIEAPDSVQKAKQVGKGRIVAAAGILVAITAVGTLVLVSGTNSEPIAQENQTQVLGAQQTLIGAPQAQLAAVLGAQAEALIDYDFRSALRGWQINYSGDHPNFLGVTHSEDRSIVVHIEPGWTAEEVAEILMHEVGHAIDLERLNDSQRAEWIALRGMPSTWWPGNGLSDFAVGAGDFAEAVSALTIGSPSNSVYGDFTPEQLNFVSNILNS